jgi:hypothetical protein
MYLVDALRVLLRRWKIVVVGCAALFVAAGAVVHYVPTQYQASGQLLFVLPADATGKKTPTNPYLNLQAGLTTVASLAASSVMTRDSSRSLVADGFTATYAAALNPGTGPLIVVTAKDADPAAAVATRDEVMRRINDELARLQSDVDVPPTQLISSRPVSVAANADPLPGSKIRALAVIGGGIVLLTLMTAFAWEGLVNRSNVAPEAATQARPQTVAKLRTTKAADVPATGPKRQRRATPGARRPKSSPDSVPIKSSRRRNAG